MDKTNNRYLVIALLVIVVLFLYFGSGTMMDSGIIGRMNENHSMGGNNWRLYPTIVTLLLGVLIGWLLFKKKN
ncbi:MAG: hypothetical protein WCS69_10835 [Ignavibacteriaceae bacterium]|jgi:Na+/H+ antiporter NhaC